MMHEGITAAWALLVLVFMLVCIVRLFAENSASGIASPQSKSHPGLGITACFRRFMQSMMASPRLLLAGKLFCVALFLLVIATGLYGTPIPERNLAPVLTWTLWWTLLIFSILFFGSGWCAVCPWDALATWLVRWRLWRRGSGRGSLNLRLPVKLRTIWAAVIMLIGLSWLELGLGITLDPYATACMALLILFLAVAFQALFERKAFCRYVCPVGRTIGFYALLVPAELKPRKQSVCDGCKTLECNRGTSDIAPCPTSLVMGRMSQSSYCVSCGNCVQSCPNGNIEWGSRRFAVLDRYQLQPSEACFMLALLAMTSLHGLSMTARWDVWISAMASMIGDSGMLLGTFSLGLAVSIIVPLLLYGAAVFLMLRLQPTLSFGALFSGMAYAVLPLAFAYHLAHNLVHLLREVASIRDVVLNPFGEGALPLSMMEKHMRMSSLPIPEWLLFSLQAGLMMFGFWVALRILQQRMEVLQSGNLSRQRRVMWPMVCFIVIASGFNLWLLTQPMIMRM
ncbi:MAG: hypothetical protein CO089_02935 [Zetaproteobacteria bacterium CG_4_9_14_0_8_um_filter_55_31]|nr:MAG: hypothetical protein CO089_02935 [Zetaproteobacteria bacterium CG_4_9_14_0_8_um_filter_55_31]